MSSAPSTIPTPLDVERLRLKPDAPTTGVVDGAWWPASRDLAAELPDVVAAVATQLGPVERVSYNLDVWRAVPRRIRTGGRVVRMGGFRSQAPELLKVIGERRMLTLLVVPPETDAEAAEHILAAASRDGNTDDIAALLSTTQS
jgi:Family of unknown function (DUF5994)